jgi:hypothetical protein
VALEGAFVGCKSCKHTAWYAVSPVFAAFLIFLLLHWLRPGYRLLVIKFADLLESTTGD